MNLIEFFRIGAYVVLTLVVLHLVKMMALNRNSDSDLAKAVAWITAG